MNWPALWAELRPILEPVLAGVVLEMLRRVLRASRAAQSHADATSGKVATTVLDVASLQGWARSVDVKLAGLDDKSTELAMRADIERIKRTLADWEREYHGKSVGAGPIPG